MTDVRRDILRCIGDTPLLALRSIPPKTGAPGRMWRSA